jgi:hypothetical protein
MAHLTTALKPHRIRPKLSPALKFLRRQRNEALTQDLAKTRQTQDEQVKALAEKHGWWVRPRRYRNILISSFVLQKPPVGAKATSFRPDQTPPSS